MLAIILFLVNFQALIQGLMRLFVTAFSLTDFQREKGNTQVIGSKDMLSRKTNYE